MGGADQACRDQGGVLTAGWPAPTGESRGTNQRDEPRRTGGVAPPMRETRLERAEARRVMRTDDAGTVVLDEAGRAAAMHSTDMHEALLAEMREEGWAVTADGHRVPPQGPAKPPGAVAGDSGAPGVKATETDGMSG